MHRRLLSFTRLVAIAGAATALHSQPLECRLNATLPPILRAESVDDFGSEIVLACTGGTPTTAGAPVPLVTFLLFTTVATTSYKTAPGWNETLLLVDEPAPANQVVCGSTGTSELAPGVCSLTGTGDGSATYSGPMRPNVYQGRAIGRNLTVWTIPFDPPGGVTHGAGRVLRFTNVRLDANSAGFGFGTPPELFAIVGAMGGSAPAIVNPMQVVGFVERGLDFLVQGASTISSCVPQNLPLISPKSGGIVSPTFGLRFVELFDNAWRTFVDTPFVTFPPNPPAEATPGFFHLLGETGFYNPAYPNLPGRGFLTYAGRAYQGTRLMAHFTNIPDGAHVFVATSGNMVDNDSGAPTAGIVQLILGPIGAYSPVFTPSGIAEIPVRSHQAFAAFEVLNASALVRERVDIPVYVAYISTNPADVTVTGSFAPLDATLAPSEPYIVPRFVSVEPEVPAAHISVCTK